MKYIILVLLLFSVAFLNAQIVPTWADSIGVGVTIQGSGSSLEIDPTFVSSQAANITDSGSGLVITNQERINYNLTYSWGNHLLSGYLTSFTESDPTVAAYIKSITAQNITDWNSHLTDTNNPHSVTKAQVGLTNVDDTSDANKPISTATQSALDLKQDDLTFDATPTDGSTNPVTSNGVFDAIAATDWATIPASQNVNFNNKELQDISINIFHDNDSDGFGWSIDENVLDGHLGFYNGNGQNYRLSKTGTPTADSHIATKKYVDDNAGGANWSTIIPTASFVSMNGVGFQGTGYYNFSDPNGTSTNWQMITTLSGSGALENDLMFFNSANGINAAIPRDGTIDENKHLVTKEYLESNVSNLVPKDTVFHSLNIGNHNSTIVVGDISTGFLIPEEYNGKYELYEVEFYPLGLPSAGETVTVDIRRERQNGNSTSVNNISADVSVSASIITKQATSWVVDTGVSRLINIDIDAISGGNPHGFAITLKFKEL